VPGRARRLARIVLEGKPAYEKKENFDALLESYSPGLEGFRADHLQEGRDIRGEVAFAI